MTFKRARKTSPRAVLKTQSNHPHPIDVYVGQKIKTLRRAQNVSQSALAEKLGVSFQQIQKYERGANRISVSRLCGIAEALKIEIAALLLGLPQISQSPSASEMDLERAVYAASPEGARLLDAFRALPIRSRRMTLGMIKALAELV